MAISELFEVSSGDIHASSELDDGRMPLVSCGETNNGVVGTFTIPPEKTIHERCLTVAYNGSWPLLTKYHPYRFAAKDDVGVLIPKQEMRESSLLYVAAVLSREKWRYSYGRKCYKEKLPLVEIRLPMKRDGVLDEDAITRLLTRPVDSYIPSRARGTIHRSRIRWARIPLSSLFDPDHGDFNSYGEFDAGDKMLVSRSAENNGVIGHYDIPEGARKFPVGTITVSTVTGDAFVQLHEFYASDKVVLLREKKPLRPTTLFFVAFALNHQKWRFSYGRSCFKRTLSLTTIDLPIKANGKPDENVMEKLVKQASYWPVVARRFPPVT
ncbi:MAG TPA: restriction endonuclease subunit S [Candidatus Thermoplasmatota archaeon]|nr:restriction endonuclease subunit S [Candidatus Thermoplasmatota archaeon]